MCLEFGHFGGGSDINTCINMGFIQIASVALPSHLSEVYFTVNPHVVLLNSV